VSVLVAQRRTIGVELFRERAATASEQERRVLVEERNRIARELHDVVAHGLSIIHVQATSAPYRLDGLSDAATAEFGEIAASARTAMTEMRQLLGVLRSADAAPDTAPQPGLDDLPALVGSVERAGVPVTLELGAALPASGLPATTAYRIVQEALSNVMRHARATRADVRIAHEGDRLVVAVEDDGRGFDPANAMSTDGGGLGLFGMKERAGYIGGRVEVASTPGGGTRVRAEIPLGEERPME